MMDQRAYWDGSAQAKTFTHPLPLAWLERIERTAAILDFGCGYGRLSDELSELGYPNVQGVDFSPQMIARARRDTPNLQFRVIEGLPLDCELHTFDAILLFAVLTCVPDDQEQIGIMTEIHRVLRPGGLMILSDMPLQAEPSHQARYRRDVARFGTFGIFETSDGAVVRHHDAAHFEGLLNRFAVVDKRHVDVLTMNKTPALALQMLARKI